jgi:hypothetical protein
MLLTRSTSTSKYVIARDIPFIHPECTSNTSPHFTSLHLFTSPLFTSLHLILMIPLPLHLIYHCFVTAFLTLFLNVFRLQGQGASKSVGNWMYRKIS